MANNANRRGSTTSGSLVELLAYSELSKGNAFSALVLEKIASNLHHGASVLGKPSRPPDSKP